MYKLSCDFNDTWINNREINYDTRMQQEIIKFMDVILTSPVYVFEELYECVKE